jgi:zinc protease
VTVPITTHRGAWIVLALLGGVGKASIPTARPAANPPPAEIGGRAPVDSNTFGYTSGGLRVIQRLTPGNDIVAVQLYMLGGVLQLTPASAGVEELALRTLPYGSAHYPGDASRHAFSHTGSRWLDHSGWDWSSVGFVGIAERFDSTWAVFADRVVHPTLDSAAIGVVRSRMIRELRLVDLSPERLAALLADSLGVEGHPYALHPYGSATSLPGLTPAVVRQYVANQFVTSRMVLVVVGNVPRAHLGSLIETTLGTLPPGHYIRVAPPELPPRHTAVVSVSRPTATSYIVGWFAGPPAASKDYPAFELATSFLSARLSYAIREWNNLSYAAYARSDSRAMTSGGLYVSTSDPKTVAPMIQRIVDSVRTADPTRFRSFDLGDIAKRSKSGFLMMNETNEGQAGSLASAEILQGDYRLAASEIQRFNGVDLGDVLRVARRYMHDLQFAYVGDTLHFRSDWVRP